MFRIANFPCWCMYKDMASTCCAASPRGVRSAPPADTSAPQPARPSSSPSTAAAKARCSFKAP